MNVASAIGYQAPAAPPAPRPDSNDAQPDDSVPVDSTTSTQFATLLALLANNGARMRPEPSRKASPDDVALLDRLLNGALGASNVTKPGSGLADAGTATTANTNAALDAVRYGMLKELATDVLNGLPTLSAADIKSTPASDLTSVPKTKRSEGLTKTSTVDERLQGLARALQSVKAPTRGITRAADAHGTSVEELMALGDKQGADVRSLLDALLSKAGTPEGMLLSNADALTAAGTSTAEMVAFAAALAAARTASAADVSTPVTDTAALNPELRAKLDRVIARMQTEYGHDVQVVETARSPERQATLYAQGRTAPGDIVTWTLDSAHLKGAAVDVSVDGSWTNAEGFARLQRIAREEGLRTLGARDPGHLELTNSSDAADPMPTAVIKSATSTPGGGAGVSGVARVASVASVAQVAVPTATVSARSDDQAPDRSSRATVGAAVSALSQGSARGSAMSNDGRRDGTGDGTRDTARDKSRESVRSTTGDTSASMSRDGAFPAYGDAQNATVNRNPSASGTDKAALAPPTGADSAQRVADATALRDDAPAKALSQMTLEVDGPGGDTQRITVDMRGNAVNTHIATDAASAERMRARVGELQGALEQHGLQSEVVRITAPTVRTVDAAEQVKAATSAGERDALRLAGASGSNAGDGASQQGLRDRPGAARDWEKHTDARNARDERQQGNSERNRRGPNYEAL